MKREIIYLTPEEQSALHKIPEDANYTRYVCWCGLLALRELKIPLSFHQLPMHGDNYAFIYMIEG